MRQQLTAEEARGQAAELADAPIEPIALPGLLPLAIRLALELPHPIYDCFYLAAAIQKDTHVVTADRKFFEKAKGEPGLADRVRLLND
jgi:predicted nucleic acid-binding protein